MHEFKEIISKNKKLILVLLSILILSVILGPFLINLLFKIVAPCEFFVAEWSAEAALEYYGAILSFLGTIILSALALWQNHFFKKENDKHILLLEQMEEQKNRPYFIVEYVSSLAKFSNLEFVIKNITNNVALNVEILDFCIVDENGKEIWKSSEKFIQDYLYQCSEFKIKLNNDILANNVNYLLFNIVFFDGLNKKHEVKLKSLLKDDKICCLSNSISNMDDIATA